MSEEKKQIKPVEQEDGKKPEKINLKDPDRLFKIDKAVLQLVEDARKEIDKIGCGVFGEDFYGEPQGSDDWKKLSPADRGKLRVAFAVGLMSNNIIEEFRENPYYVAIALGPGPLGAVVAAGLLASYAVRTDERGKQVRAELREMLDKGIELEDYHHVLRPKKYGEEGLEVDDMALIKWKFNTITTNGFDVTKEFLVKANVAYGQFKDATAQDLAIKTHFALGPVIGHENTQTILDKFGKGYNATEDGAVYVYGKGEKLFELTKNRVVIPALKEAFEGASTAHKMAQKTSKDLIDGVEYTKQEAKDLWTKVKNIF